MVNIHNNLRRPPMLTIFSKPNCPYCTSAQQYLTSMNIAYTTKDITRDPMAHSFLIGEGHKTVPQIYQDDKLLVEGGYTGLTSISIEQLKEMIGEINVSELEFKQL